MMENTENALQQDSDRPEQQQASTVSAVPAASLPSFPSTLPPELLASLSAIQVPPSDSAIASGNSRLAQISNDLDLADVLTADVIRPILQDAAAREALFPNLPTGTENSAQGIEEVIRSPQFQQACHSLSVALHSGQLAPLVIQFGMKRLKIYSY